MFHLQRAGLTLNIQKCEFSQKSLKFLGHIVDAQGVHADPGKTRAIGHYFPTPSTVTELQRFMGMVNQLGKFVPGLADINAPLWQLLCKDSAWYWNGAQQTAFQQGKEKLASPEILAHYNPNRPTVITTDASSTGLGVVLLQTQDNGQRCPICYISTSLCDAERNYAVIKKEALASTWACEPLEEYVLGLRFTMETDHKPLVPLLTTTDLSKMPPGCNTTLKSGTFLVNVKFQLMHFHMLQLAPRTCLMYSLLMRLKPLLAPQWTNFLPLLSAFKRS